MTFWIVATLLALGAGALIAAALLRGRASAAPPAAYDLEIYRVQLAGVDKDLARGVITQTEAGRLRAEVSRRILAADAQLRAHGADGGQPRGAGRVMAALLVIAVGAGTIFGYWQLGAPGYPDQPRGARLAASDAERANRLSQAEAEERFGPKDAAITPPEDFAQLMVQLRAAVEQRPDDVRGLALLARNEASLGNTGAAQRAQERLIAAKGDDVLAADHAFLADLMITAAGGYVSAEAEASLRAALAIDPAQPEARYYLGVYFAQVDRADAAFRTWEKLLSESPPDAVWVAPLRGQIEEVAERAGINYTLPPQAQADLTAPRGPSADDIEAASEMTEAERQTFVRSMVDGLLARLASEGGPPQDWARLIVALGVIGETERAAAILDEARGTFAEDAEAMALLDGAAERAGLPPAGAAPATGTAE
ncbi:c-type cytochrome biogenesis protein CcmI [Roseovarius nanhaiticus]|uniref:c-type cytochrome biogenesis protein CcmI n=1 Tax=Roseovarius nanhaiticus TaxID=573024 RepID=UPI00248FB189|nr:c-type cytochrome biogenesis protein CcmI [Roseovarius nanhaiticus]